VARPRASSEPPPAGNRGSLDEARIPTGVRFLTPDGESFRAPDHCHRRQEWAARVCEWLGAVLDPDGRPVGLAA